MIEFASLKRFEKQIVYKSWGTNGLKITWRIGWKMSV